MTWAFNDWTPDDDPGHVLSLVTPADWAALEARYSGGKGNGPLHRVLEIAAGHGVTSVVVERRYIDVDWRSEHARFYGATFRRYPSVCHRLHFFTAEVPASLDNLSDLKDHYRGYSVIRPLPHAPVGRTMIAPPAELNAAVVAGATETVDLFGWPLDIRAMPFISQDAQYLRCAHASIWMVLRHAALVHGLPRRLPEEIQAECLGGYVVGRELPSAGLSLPQMLTGLRRLGMPAELRPLAAGASPLTLYGVACRYLNSGLPPIAVSECHAWVVVAWKRTPSPGHRDLTLWRHDDAAGPYIRVDDPSNEPDPAHRPWANMITPMLPKMYIDAERAEVTGRMWLEQTLDSGNVSGTLAAAAATRGHLTFRTYAVLARDYKQRLAKRGLDPDLARLYRLAHMARYVWVVEAVDRLARQAGQPDVLGEVLLDATMSQYATATDAGVLGLHLEDFAFTSGPDHKQVQILAVQDAVPYLSDLAVR